MRRGNEDTPDLELVRRVARGDEAAFAALYERHKPFAYRVAYQITLDEHLALDAVQETFAWAARAITRPGFRLNARFTTLIYPAARHSALALRQKQKRERPTDPVAISAAADYAAPDANRARAEQQEASRAEAKRLAGAVAQLSEAHQQILQLHYFLGHTLDDAAEILQIPAGTARSRLHKALERLRQTLS